MRRKQQFIANTFLLTVISFLLRGASVSFQAYIANRIGAAGMGLFSLIMSVYQFGITFACSGIGLAATKLVSEELAVGKEDSAKRAVKQSLIHGLTFGGLAACLIFFGAPFVSRVLLDDLRTVLPLRILSVSLPCVAMSSALTGYFSAVGRVGKSAAVQVLEQAIRIVGCVWLFRYLGTGRAETACVAVVTSGSLAEVLSFLVLFGLYVLDARRYTRKTENTQITRRLLGISLPVAVSSYVRAGLSTMEHAFIPKGLKMHGGDTETALSAYGTVHGMALPIILFPSAVLQAFSTMLVPEVTIYHKRGDAKKINSLIERSLSVTLAFSVGAAGILFFFADEIGMAIYQSKEVAYFIRVIAPLAVVMYADGVVDAVLKGMNQQVYSMGYNIIDSALAVVLMLFLLPAKGIDGYVMIIYITEMVNAFLSISRLIYISDFKLRPFRWAVIPILCIFVCSVFAKTIFTGVPSAVLSLVLYGGVMMMFCSKKIMSSNT